MSDDLLELFLRDREAHESPPMPGTPAYVALRTADAGRRSRVRQIANTGALQSAEDYYRAAMILQHGDDPADFDQARVWALQSAELGHRPARWLAAAALDRSLMVRGHPQKYGTQIVPDGVRQRVWDIDPATTDSDRAEWDVPPLAEMFSRAANLTVSEAMPNMAEAPNWLLEAIRRWRGIEKHAGSPNSWVILGELREEGGDPLLCALDVGSAPNQECAESIRQARERDRPRTGPDWTYRTEALLSGEPLHLKLARAMVRDGLFYFDLTIRNPGERSILIPSGGSRGLEFTRTVDGEREVPFVEILTSCGWAGGGLTLRPGGQVTQELGVRERRASRTPESGGIDLMPGEYLAGVRLRVSQGYYDGDSHRGFAEARRIAEKQGAVLWTGEAVSNLVLVHFAPPADWPASLPWVVWRTDDNGNDFEVERLFSHEEADQRAAELERKGHKQTYWVARG